MNKTVKLLKVEYNDWSGNFEISYHIMNETGKQYKNAGEGYGWVVSKEDIGKVLNYDRIYEVVDELNENQVQETVRLLFNHILNRNQKKIDNIVEQNNKLTKACEKFMMGA